MPAGTVLLSFLMLAATVASTNSHDRRGCNHKRSRIARNANVTARDSGYELMDSYGGSGFFNQFDFFTDPDPTNGLVTFVDQDTAMGNNLTYFTDSGAAVMHVDSSTWLGPGQPRQSLRITSKKTYGNALIVLDLAAMPHGCSVWPAFWTTSAAAVWPNGGEIDIVEGVDEASGNQMTLHTLPGCTLDTNAAAAANAEGVVLSTTCDAFADGNSGCGVHDPDPNSYGHDFNVNGGGIFATLRDDSGVKIFRFDRNDIPGDLASKQPNPAGWGPPKAFWSAASCPVGQFIDDSQTLIFDITLCGDWAGSAFSQHGCPGACTDYVADPTHYTWARFEVNALDVYSVPS